MPTIGSRIDPSGAGISSISPSVKPLQLARGCPRPSAPAGGRLAYMLAASPATGGRCAVSARLAMSVATIITGVWRNMIRAFADHLHARDAGHRRELRSHRPAETAACGSRCPATASRTDRG